MQYSKSSNNLDHSGIGYSIRIWCKVQAQVVLEKVLAELERGQVATDLDNTMTGCHRHNIHTISGTTKPSSGIPNLDCWGTKNWNRGMTVGGLVQEGMAREGMVRAVLVLQKR